MGKHSPVAVAPRYMQQFSCIGGACVENCCTGWTVAIDKASYQQYRAVRREPLASLMHDSVQRLPGGHGQAYAVIRLQPDGACPFLDSSKLCRIQAELGEAALSGACSVYPRYHGLDAQQHRLYATLSCPEAARLALSDPAALDPVELVLPYANAQQVPLTHRRAAPAAGEADPVRKHAGLLGSAIEGLVRLPTLTAAQSLVQGGLLLRRISRIEAQGSAAEQEMAQAMEHYLAPQQLAQLPGLLSGLQVPREAQLAMLFDTTRRYLQAHGGRPSFAALLADVERGLCLEQGMPAVLARLDSAAREVWAPLEAAKPQLLKNFLLNELGKSLFPQQGRAGLEREFMGLALRFALVRFYLLGLAAWRGSEFGVADVVRVVYVVARNIEHSDSFMPALLDELQARDALRIELLTTLVL